MVRGGKNFPISWEDKRYSELRNGVPEVTVPSPEAVLERNVTTACLKRLEQLFPLRLCHQNHLGNLEKYRLLGPSQRHRFRHWGGVGPW